VRTRGRNGRTAAKFAENESKDTRGQQLQLSLPCSLTRSPTHNLTLLRPPSFLQPLALPHFLFSVGVIDVLSRGNRLRQGHRLQSTIGNTRLETNRRRAHEWHVEAAIHDWPNTISNPSLRLAMHDRRYILGKARLAMHALQYMIGSPARARRSVTRARAGCCSWGMPTASPSAR
jgi:hypothetical protein